eukprot:1034269-Pyramimonas_sp.AAC.1
MFRDIRTYIRRVPMTRSRSPHRGSSSADASSTVPAKDGEIGAELMREAERARRGIEATKQGRWSTSEMADGATLVDSFQEATA